MQQIFSKEGRHYTNSIVTLFCYCSKAENYKNVTVPQVHIFAVVVQLVLLGSDDALDIAKKKVKKSNCKIIRKWRLIPFLRPDNILHQKK